MRSTLEWKIASLSALGCLDILGLLNICQWIRSNLAYHESCCATNFQPHNTGYILITRRFTVISCWSHVISVRKYWTISSHYCAFRMVLVMGAAIIASFQDCLVNHTTKAVKIFSYISLLRKGYPISQCSPFSNENAVRMFSSLSRKVAGCLWVSGWKVYIKLLQSCRRVSLPLKRVYIIFLPQRFISSEATLW